MIALLLALLLDSPNSFAPVCHLRAGAFRPSLTKPEAIVYVEYMAECCGDELPVFESETASILHVEEMAPNSISEGCGVPILDDEGLVEDVDDCPVRVFFADVVGPIGIHKVRVYALDEGQAEITVKLRGFTERSKLAGQ